MSVVGIARSAAEKALEELRPLCEELPQSVIDPISLEVFDKPMVTRCGHTFERESIVKLWDANPRRNIYGQKIIDCPVCRLETGLGYIFYDQAFQETIEHMKKINEVFIKNMGAKNRFRVSYGPLPEPPKGKLPIPAYLSILGPLPPIPKAFEQSKALPPLPPLVVTDKRGPQKENAPDEQPENDKRLESLSVLCKELPQSAIDPISLEPFSEPMVTRCGHTFERDSLIELYKSNPKRNMNGRQIITCPICRTDTDTICIFYDQSFQETVDHLKKIQEVFNKYVTTKQT